MYLSFFTCSADPLCRLYFCVTSTKPFEKSMVYSFHLINDELLPHSSATCMLRQDRLNSQNNSVIGRLSFAQDSHCKCTMSVCHRSTVATSHKKCASSSEAACSIFLASSAVAGRIFLSFFLLLSTQNTKWKVFVMLLMTCSGRVTMATTSTCMKPCMQASQALMQAGTYATET